MAYTGEVINVGDTIAASWGNKVETHLERLGNYMGVVASVANLPDVATLDEGDWYWCKSERIVKMKVNGAYISSGASSEVSPSSPSAVTGMFWYDTANKILKVYTGSAWTPIGESLIDTSQVLSSIRTALIVQNPSIVFNSIVNKPMWDYFLTNSTVRSEVLKHKMYIDAMAGVGRENLALDTGMENAILGSINPLSLALSSPSFWLNPDLLTYWMDNYWTKYNYSGSPDDATTTVAGMNSKYGFKIYCPSYWSSNFPYFSVNMDLTDFNYLEFWYSISGGEGDYVKLYIGTTLIHEFLPTGSGTYNVDISGFSGVKQVKFLFNHIRLPKLYFSFTDLVIS